MTLFARMEAYAYGAGDEGPQGVPVAVGFVGGLAVDGPEGELLAFGVLGVLEEGPDAG